MKENKKLSKWRSKIFENVLFDDPKTSKELIIEYMKETSIHGMRYVVKDGAALWERLCWVLAIVVCTTFAGVYVQSVWVKFRTSPIVTSVATTHYPLYKLPFPAVSICPANRVRKREGLKLLTRYLGINELNESMEVKLWHVMSAISLTQFPFYYRVQKHCDAAKDILHLFDTFNISEFVLKAMPPCEEIFHECFWYGMNKDCCEIFAFQRTELGYCFSFNSLTADSRLHCTPWAETNFEESTISPWTVQNFSDCTLRRNTGAGTTTGLELFMNKAIDADSLGDGQKDGKGFRIYVHDPSDLPEASKGIFVPENNFVTFTVKIAASITVSTNAVRELGVEERQCCFPEEIPLTFFKSYTQESCYIECRMKYIISICNCTPYYFDASKVNVPTCKLADLDCVGRVNENLRSFSPPPGTPGFDRGASTMLNCSQCKPTCHSSLYSIDTILSENFKAPIDEASAYLDIYYKDLAAVKYTRDLAFGWMQLLVSFGGIAGLFLGVSILSGVEIFYYIVKIIINLYKQSTKGELPANSGRRILSSNHAWDVKRRIGSVVPLRPYIVGQDLETRWGSED